MAARFACFAHSALGSRGGCVIFEEAHGHRSSAFVVNQVKDPLKTGPLANHLNDVLAVREVEVVEVADASDHRVSVRASCRCVAAAFVREQDCCIRPKRK